MRRPWAKDEFPVLAGWLEANERPLALLVQASLRPRRYDPMICEKKRASSVIVMPSTADNYYRHFCSALAARAMLRLGAGKPDDAWDDLLVCHRLTRVVDQGVFAVEAAVVTGIERGCFANDQAFLRHARLSAEQATNAHRPQQSATCPCAGGQN